MFGNEDELTRAIERLAIDAEPSPGHREALRERMLVAFERARAGAARPRRRGGPAWAGRLIMKSRFVQAAAAVIVVCVVGVITLWDAGNGGAGIALADVWARIENAQTVCFKMTTYRDGRQAEMWAVSYKAPGLMRSEMKEAVCVFDWTKGKYIALLTEDKTAILTTVADMQNPYHRNWLEELKATVGSDEAEEAGNKTLSGRTAKGWRVRDVEDGQEWLVTVWADAESGELLEVEFQAGNTRMVMSEFRVNAELDDALFSLEPPKGYRLISQAEVNSSDLSEKDVATLLRVWAMGNGDVFPDRIDPTEFGSASRKVDWRRLGIDSQEEGKAVGLAIHRGFLFLYLGYEWSYAGKGVRLGAKDKPIFWYRPKGKETFRVIYADLSIKDASADELPEVPTTQPAAEAPGE